MLFELVSRLLVGAYNLEEHIGIKGNKFGVGVLRPCIPNASGIHTGHVRHLEPMLFLFIHSSNFVLLGCIYILYWLTHEGFISLIRSFQVGNSYSNRFCILKG